ncbi:phosphodiester glycosidase family protein [Nakamurella deserti]|uniref:phosphodiester glycosidase family protein n=1 Tax=Nakamurella deserti TaxID=2164074 RepID=UPI000DBE14B0|nr:phosphodiester glycosidase family protein [Nakamurella deserti]
MEPTTPPGAPDVSRRRFLRRALLGGAVAAGVSAGGATAWALDRFVIDHVEVSDVSALQSTYTAPATGASATSSVAAVPTTDAGSAPVVGATSYVSDAASVSISTVTTGSGAEKVTYFVADLILSDMTVLRSAFADDSFGENIVENTSDIARDNNAIFAVNGDYYGFRDTGIVIRNGIAFRNAGARAGLALHRDGSMTVYDETTTTADRLVAEGVWHTLSFGPALLVDGRIVDGIDDVEVDTNVGNHSIQGRQPRTGVGLLDRNHLVLVVVDGRSDGYSAGVTMTGFAALFQELGATVAYNIDGGGSSTMYFDGRLVNNPLGRNSERGTSDILWLAGPS